MNAIAKTMPNSPVSEYAASCWSIAPDRPFAKGAANLLVAVATHEGGVDGDFDAAQVFDLYEMSDKAIGRLGRQLCPLKHGKPDIQRKVRLLKDCDMVLCAQISDACQRALARQGVACCLAPAGQDSDSAVREFMRGRSRPSGALSAYE